MKTGFKKRRSSFISPMIKMRLKKFVSIRRGLYSLLIIVALYGLSFFNEFFINGNALFIRFEGKTYFCAYKAVKLKKVVFKKAVESKKAFNTYRKAVREDASLLDEKKMETLERESRYYNAVKSAFSSHRKLKKLFKEQDQGNWALLTIYPYGPTESLLDELTANPPTPPGKHHIFGTDNQGRDVFARLAYGFRISMTFSLILVFCSYLLGIFVGGLIGYYGGKADFFGMRIIEIWSSVPFLFLVMIISSMLIPDFRLLIMLLAVFGWMGMAWYIRAEFLREKAKEYVQSAVAIGVSDPGIIFKHILPNALTPVISFLPFSVIGGIGSLVSLDFLGFGLPAPTPSWGELLNQGVTNLSSWWLTVAPVGAIFFTLLLITFIGEAIREAFDPKMYSRLR